MVNQLEKNGGRYALCTVCIDVGQGIASDHRARLNKKEHPPELSGVSWLSSQTPDFSLSLTLP